MTSTRSSTLSHPFAHTTQLIEVIPSPKIDVEEESELYDALCDDEEIFSGNSIARPTSPPGPPSIFSKDIWLGDNSGLSQGFAQEVKISGWTSVGDKPGGAYIVYDCVITTKEGPIIHALKRYSSFAALDYALRHTLPLSQQPFIPTLPPKAPLARYRPAFLDHRRRLLQHWLSAVFLHPDIGGSQAVRLWVMN